MFSWDAAKALKNYEKHGVSFEEAATIFDDPYGLEVEDVEHMDDLEQRWKLLAFSVKNRLLVVVYAARRFNDGKETTRIISARHASRAERDFYAGQ